MTNTEVNEKLGNVAKAFVADRDQWDGFIEKYTEQAIALAGKVDTLGFDYELVYVPGGQTMRGLLDLLHETRKDNGYEGDPAKLEKSLWKGDALKRMKRIDGLGLHEEATLSALLLNPEDSDEKGGLFFTDMMLEDQMARAARQIRRRPDMRYLSIAEYICADIIHAANNERLLDFDTSTRFLQYGWFETAGYGRCVPYVLLCREQLQFSRVFGFAYWEDGVRFSVM